MAEIHEIFGADEILQILDGVSLNGSHWDEYGCALWREEIVVDLEDSLGIRRLLSVVE